MDRRKLLQNAATIALLGASTPAAAGDRTGESPAKRRRRVSVVRIIGIREVFC